MTRITAHPHPYWGNTIRREIERNSNPRDTRLGWRVTAAIVVCAVGLIALGVWIGMSVK